MNLNSFLSQLANSGQTTSTDLGIAILWWHSQFEAEKRCSAGDISRILKAGGFGNPNSTALMKSLKKTRNVLTEDNGIKLKTTEIAILSEKFKDIISTPPVIHHQTGFLSDEVWKNTRSYLEIICKQINGCYYHHYYDACAVLARRAIETLIIDAYESTQKEGLIKDSSGNFFMLNLLIDKVSHTQEGLNISRDAKAGLVAIKKIGDRSAHNRRFNATKNDIDLIRDQLRLCIQELSSISYTKK